MTQHIEEIAEDIIEKEMWNCWFLFFICFSTCIFIFIIYFRGREDVNRDFDVILMLCCWRNVTRKLLIKWHTRTQWIHIYNYIRNINNLRTPPVHGKIVKRGLVRGDKKLGDHWSNCGHLRLFPRKLCVVSFTAGHCRSSSCFLHFRTIDSLMLNSLSRKHVSWQVPFSGPYTLTL